MRGRSSGIQFISRFLRTHDFEAEVLNDNQIKETDAALIAISTGGEYMTKLPVPVEVGTRLLACYDGLAEEFKGQLSEDSIKAKTPIVILLVLLK
jgi:hypothetical protein